MTGSWEVFLLLAALAAGAGVSLPLILFLPWLFGLLPGTEPLPHGLEALASPAPAGLGALLLLLALVLRRVPGLRGTWELFHSMATLPTAALLVHLIEPPELVPGGRLVAGIAAVGLVMSLQAARLGARVLDRVALTGTRRPTPAVRELLEAGVVLLLVAGAYFSPPAAGLGGFLLLALVMGFGRSALRTTRFLPALLGGVLRDLGGTRGWRPEARTPAWVREQPGAEGEGGGVRASVAGLSGAAETGGFRRGWLVAGRGAPRFLYRTPARIWEMDLASARVVEIDVRPWAVRVCLDLERSRPVLLVPRDGPGPEAGFGFPSAPARPEENL